MSEKTNNREKHKEIEILQSKMKLIEATKNKASKELNDTKAKEAGWLDREKKLMLEKDEL